MQTPKQTPLRRSPRLLEKNSQNQTDTPTTRKRSLEPAEEPAAKRHRTVAASPSPAHKVPKQQAPPSRPRQRTNYASKAAVKSMPKDQRLVLQELDPITLPRQKRRAETSESSAKTGSESVESPAKRPKTSATGRKQPQDPFSASPPKRTPTDEPHPGAGKKSSEKTASGKSGLGNMSADPAVNDPRGVFKDHVFCMLHLSPFTTIRIL